MLNVFPLLLKGVLVSAMIQAAIGFTAKFYDFAGNNVSQEESIECTMDENPHPAAGSQASVILAKVIKSSSNCFAADTRLAFKFPKKKNLTNVIMDEYTAYSFLRTCKPDLFGNGVAQVYFHGTANCSVRGNIVQYDCLSMEEFPVDAIDHLYSIKADVFYYYQLKIIVKQVLKTLIEFGHISNGWFAHGDIKAENIMLAKLLKAEDIEPNNPKVIEAIHGGMLIYGRAVLIDFGLADYSDSGRVKRGGDLRFARPKFLGESDDEISKTKRDLFAFASSMIYMATKGRLPWLGSKIEKGDHNRIKKTCDMEKFFRVHRVPSEFEVLVRAFRMSLSAEPIKYDVLISLAHGTPRDL